MKQFILTMSLVAMIALLSSCKDNCVKQQREAVNEPFRQEKEFIKDEIRHRSSDVQTVEIIDSTIVYTHIFDGVVDVKTYTYNGDVCVEAERLYVFPDQMSALRHYRRAVEQADLYENIEMFNNQVKYELKDAQHKLETEGLTIGQLKKKFDDQIADCEAELKKKDHNKK